MAESVFFFSNVSVCSYSIITSILLLTIYTISNRLQEFPYLVTAVDVFFSHYCDFGETVNLRTCSSLLCRWIDRNYVLQPLSALFMRNSDCSFGT